MSTSIDNSSKVEGKTRREKSFSSEKLVVLKENVVFTLISLTFYREVAARESADDFQDFKSLKGSQNCWRKEIFRKKTPTPRWWWWYEWAKGKEGKIDIMCRMFLEGEKRKMSENENKRARRLFPALGRKLSQGKIVLMLTRLRNFFLFPLVSAIFTFPVCHVIYF